MGLFDKFKKNKNEEGAEEIKAYGWDELNEFFVALSFESFCDVIAYWADWGVNLLNKSSVEAKIAWTC